MKRRALNYFRVSVVFVIPLLIVMSVYFQWTRIQLGFKGYGKEERAIILKLEDQEIEEYLALDYAIDIPSWDEVSNNDKHYYDYEILHKTIKNKKQVVQMVDSVYKEYYSYLIEHGYRLETIRSLMG